MSDEFDPRLEYLNGDHGNDAPNAREREHIAAIFSFLPEGFLLRPFLQLIFIPAAYDSPRRVGDRAATAMMNATRGTEANLESDHLRSCSDVGEAHRQLLALARERDQLKGDLQHRDRQIEGLETELLHSKRRNEVLELTHEMHVRRMHTEQAMNKRLVEELDQVLLDKAEGEKVDVRLASDSAVGLPSGDSSAAICGTSQTVEARQLEGVDGQDSRAEEIEAYFIMRLESEVHQLEGNAT